SRPETRCASTELSSTSRILSSFPCWLSARAVAISFTSLLLYSRAPRRLRPWLSAAAPESQSPSSPFQPKRWHSSESCRRPDFPGLLLHGKPWERRTGAATLSVYDWLCADHLHLRPGQPRQSEAATLDIPRSEERRVGKECRSR